MKEEHILSSLKICNLQWKLIEVWNISNLHESIQSWFEQIHTRSWLVLGIEDFQNTTNEI